MLPGIDSVSPFFSLILRKPRSHLIFRSKSSKHMDIFYSQNRVHPAKNDPMNRFDSTGDSVSLDLHLCILRMIWWIFLKLCFSLLISKHLFLKCASYLVQSVQPCNNSWCFLFPTKQREVEEIKGASKSQIINLLTVGPKGQLFTAGFPMMGTAVMLTIFEMTSVWHEKMGRLQIKIIRKLIAEVDKYPNWCKWMYMFNLLAGLKLKESVLQHLAPGGANFVCTCWGCCEASWWSPKGLHGFMGKFLGMSTQD